MDEAASNGEDAEAEGGGWNEPPGTDIFAEDVRRDFEHDVADVEDGEHGVVVVAVKVEVLL